VHNNNQCHYHLNVSGVPVSEVTEESIAKAMRRMELLHG
jgi:hypothetical protein